MDLTQTALFRGSTWEEVEEMLGCLDATTATYQKGNYIYRAGETIHSLGLVLSGSVNVEYDDLWGNKSILAHVETGQVFAETYACLPGQPLLISVAAAEACTVLFLRVSGVLHICSKSCAHHRGLVQNLLEISSRKNLALAQRSLHTAVRSIRGRLLSYLSQRALEAGSFQVSIPFNRQQLADYLGVDRSALSRELARMQEEGLLTYEKNRFTLAETLPL